MEQLYYLYFIHNIELSNYPLLFIIFYNYIVIIDHFHQDYHFIDLSLLIPLFLFISYSINHLKEARFINFNLLTDKYPIFLILFPFLLIINSFFKFNFFIDYFIFKCYKFFLCYILC